MFVISESFTIFKIHAKILRSTKQTLQKAACTSILSFFVANLFLLYDREPHVDDLGNEAGSSAIERMQQDASGPYGVM